MEFQKYMHVEKLGNTEVDGIELSKVHVFPKLDGTNGSLWMDNLKLCGGSRNRLLALDNDNHGFFDYAINKDQYINFFLKFPNFKLYGEWLVPHTLKTYRESAWKKFYVFDVWDEAQCKLLTYEEYYPLLEKYDIDFIPCQAIYINGINQENIIKEASMNTYLIEEGQGSGEGIVIKNYDFINKYGRQTWGKFVLSEFKDKRHDPPEKQQKDIIERKAVCKYCTNALIDKVCVKVGEESKNIPRILQTVFYDLVREHSWDIVKDFKHPIIDFRILHKLTIDKIKNYKKELF